MLSAGCSYVARLNYNRLMMLSHYVTFLHSYELEKTQESYALSM